MGKLFGTDGIRGLANTFPMDAETAMAVGHAMARYFKSRQTDKTFIFIGQDTRLSGDMLVQAVGAGICSAGMDISLLGIVPTPAVAYLTRTAGAAAGVVISASHNPFEDNGIKIFNSNGYKLTDKAEDQIETLMSERRKPLVNNVPPDQIGKIRPAKQNLKDYLNFLQGTVPHLVLDDLKVVLDCANGSTHCVAPELFIRLGAQVVPIFCTPDGININARCGSQHPQTLAETVIREKAHLGLAFDGDGDRLIAVDEKGTVLTGDQIMAICASHMITNGKLKNRTVVNTVMSNMGFHLAMQQLGVKLSTAQVGDRYVIQKMLNQDAVLGGEDSGHIIFRDVHTTGDGLMAALRLADALVSADGDQPLSEKSRIMTVFPQVLINVEVASKPEISTIPEIVDSIQAVEQVLGQRGRVLVRYSGTQSKCRVMVEGPVRDQTEALCRQIADVVKSCLN